MKNLFIKIILLIIIFFNQSCEAKSFFNYSVKLYSKQWACCFAQKLESHIYYRAVIYNALGLSDEQSEIFINSIRENRIDYKQISDELIAQAVKLDTLKSNKAPLREQLKQKRKIKKILKELNKKIKKEDKLLMKSLTRSQKTKYKLIVHLEKHDIKQECRKKDYYKSNPRMQRFEDLE